MYKCCFALFSSIIKCKMHTNQNNPKNKESLFYCSVSIKTDVIHVIRSLLCTATNETPHERMFKHRRKSGGFGATKALPVWLSNPGSVLLRNFVRANKNDPLVKTVELLEANQVYAHIRTPDGRETTVSTRDLAPYPGRKRGGGVCYGTIPSKWN